MLQFLPCYLIASKKMISFSWETAQSKSGKIRDQAKFLRCPLFAAPLATDLLKRVLSHCQYILKCWHIRPLPLAPQCLYHCEDGAVWVRLKLTNNQVIFQRPWLRPHHPYWVPSWLRPHCWVLLATSWKLSPTTLNLLRSYRWLDLLH